MGRRWSRVPASFKFARYPLWLICHSVRASEKQSTEHRVREIRLVYKEKDGAGVPIGPETKKLDILSFRKTDDIKQIGCFFQY